MQYNKIITLSDEVKQIIQTYKNTDMFPKDVPVSAPLVRVVLADDRIFDLAIDRVGETYWFSANIIDTNGNTIAAFSPKETLDEWSATADNGEIYNIEIQME